MNDEFIMTAVPYMVIVFPNGMWSSSTPMKLTQKTETYVVDAFLPEEAIQKVQSLTGVSNMAFAIRGYRL